MKHSSLLVAILMGAGLSSGVLTACSDDDDDTGPTPGGKTSGGTSSHGGNGGGGNSTTGGSGGKSSAGSGGSGNGGVAGSNVGMAGEGGAPIIGGTSSTAGDGAGGAGANAGGAAGAAGEAGSGGEGGEGGAVNPCAPSLADGKPVVPDEIKVKDTATLVAVYAAEGTQTYTCEKTGDGAGATYAWSTASVPDAKLYDADCSLAGTHYKGPHWKANDGSDILGKVEKTTASLSSASIKRVLLSVVSEEGAGVLVPVKAVQRLDTVGGIAPTGGCDVDHLDAKIAVPYTANYYFYSGADIIP